MIDDDRRNARRHLRHEITWAIAFAAMGITVTVAGQPRPLSIIVGAIGGLTGAFIFGRAFIDR